MSYTTQLGQDGKWEVRYGGRLIVLVPFEEVADDIAIALAAARHERISREAAVNEMRKK